MLAAVQWASDAAALERKLVEPVTEFHAWHPSVES